MPFRLGELGLAGAGQQAAGEDGEQRATGHAVRIPRPGNESTTVGVSRRCAAQAVA
jgi:hypothetical protein